MNPIPIAVSIGSLGIATLVAVAVASEPVRVAYQLFYFIEGTSAFMCL
jgi:hypothetical protein